MRKKNAKISRVIAGFLAVMMTLGSGADKVFAAESDKSQTEFVNVIADEADEADINETDESETEGSETDVVSESSDTVESEENSDSDTNETTEDVSKETTESDKDESDVTEQETTTEEVLKEENSTEEAASEEITTEDTPESDNNKKNDADDSDKKLSETDKKNVLNQNAADKLHSDTDAMKAVKTNEEKANANGIVEVTITKQTFPDDKLRQYVSSEFDLDHDGRLNEYEITHTRNIEVQNMGIESLKGIEYLVELRGIYC